MLAFAILISRVSGIADVAGQKKFKCFPVQFKNEARPTSFRFGLPSA